MNEGFEIQCLPGMGLPDLFDPQASGLDYPEDWLFEALTRGESDSGERVNPVTALSHGPVWQAINILAGDVGQLPWNKMKWTYKGDKAYQERDEDHPLDWLIAYQPNSFQTPSIWKETMMSWAVGWGNGISAIIRVPSGERGFLPLLPELTGYVSDDEHGFLITSEVAGRRVALTPDEVFHIRGLTSNGFWGLSAVNVCKNRIGHGMSMLRHGNAVFRNGCRPAGVLEHPTKLDASARANLRKEWRDIHGGVRNSGEIAILWEGMKYNSLSMSNEDAQWLEGMDMDREFIAGLFGLPGFKLGAMKNSSVRANLEEQNKDYYNTSLGRWLNRFNEEAERKLLSMRERRSKLHSFMWRLDAFLQGNTQQLMSSLSVAVTSELMTRNEGRERLGLNPDDNPESDQLRNPSINPKTEPTAPPEPPDAGDKDESDVEGKDLARDLVRQQAAALLVVEANRIERAAKTANNFLESVSDFYETYTELAQTYLETPAKIARHAGYSSASWRDVAELHARDGLQAVLAQAELVTKSGLFEVISARADVVRGLADELTESILGEQ